ncbi:MAG: transglutaminase domain-containing protein [Firmicutes bacterium]|nr:transglutaminase domain-containing protein [Bacillota bacterium]
MNPADGFIIYLNKETVRTDYGKLILLAIASFGTALLLGQGFIETPDWRWLLPAAGIGTVCASINSHRFQQLVLGAVIVLTALLVTAGRGLFRTGLLQMVNGGIALFNVHYGTDVYYYVLPEQISQQLGVDLFASALIFLMAYLYSELLNRRRIFLFVLVQALLIGLIAFLYATAAYGACCFGVVASAGAVIWSRSGQIGQRSMTALLVLLLALALAASLSYMRWGSYQPGALADTMRMTVSDQAETLRYGEQDSPRGDLAKAAGYRGNDRTRLIVGADVSGNYYLKGYVGGTYQNGRWQEIDVSRYNKKQAGLFVWLKTRDFFPLAQNYQYLQLLEENGQTIGGRKSRVVVANLKANRKFLYIPYGISDADIRTIKGIHRDMNIRQTEDDASVMEYDTILYDTSEAFSAGNPAWMNTRRADASVEDFREAQVEYRTFVYDNYLELDPQAEALLRKQLEASDGEGYLEATQTIRRWLKNDAPGISTGPSLLKDPLYRFMFAQRQGNSCYYASAGVLMFRYFGIPARYAEGYLASLGRQSYHARLSTDVDLSGTSGELPEYQKRISGSHMHAWVEIYKDGIGWVPVEVTPDFVEEIYQQKQQTQQQMQSKSNRNEGPQEKEPGDFKRMIQIIIGAFLAALLLAAALILLRRRRILKRRSRILRRLRPEDRLEALLPWLKASLWMRGDSEAGLPDHLREMLQKYRFRDGTMSVADYEELYAYSMETCTAAYKEKGWRGKLYMKYIKALI